MVLRSGAKTPEDWLQPRSVVSVRTRSAANPTSLLSRARRRAFPEAPRRCLVPCALIDGEAQGERGTDLDVVVLETSGSLMRPRLPGGRKTLAFPAPAQRRRRARYRSRGFATRIGGSSRRSRGSLIGSVIGHLAAQGDEVCRTDAHQVLGNLRCSGQCESRRRGAIKEFAQLGVVRRTKDFLKRAWSSSPSMKKRWSATPCPMAAERTNVDATGVLFGRLANERVLFFGEAIQASCLCAVHRLSVRNISVQVRPSMLGRGRRLPVPRA